MGRGWADSGEKDHLLEKCYSFLLLLQCWKLLFLRMPMVMLLMSLTSMLLTTLADFDLKQLVVLERACSYLLIYHSHKTQTQVENSMSAVSVCFV